MHINKHKFYFCCINYNALKLKKEKTKSSSFTALSFHQNKLHTKNWNCFFFFLISHPHVIVILYAKYYGDMPLGMVGERNIYCEWIHFLRIIFYFFFFFNMQKIKSFSLCCMNLNRKSNIIFIWFLKSIYLLPFPVSELNIQTKLNVIKRERKIEKMSDLCASTFFFTP